MAQQEVSKETMPDEAPKKKSNLVSNILIVLGVVLLGVAGFIFFQNSQNYKKIDEENDYEGEAFDGMFRFEKRMK